MTRLDYAAKPDSGRRSRVLGWLTMSAIVLGVAAWAVTSAPGALRRWQWARLYRQCAAHSAPPEQVVYAQDPDAAAVLLRRENYVPLPTLVRTASPAAGRAVPQWEALQRLAGSAPTRGPLAVLFLHRLRNGRSPECFVCVAATGVSDGWPLAFVIDCKQIGPDRTLGPTTGANDEILGRPFTTGVQDRSLHFYAGQLDASDASHFTIAYEMASGRGTIDGWLRDGDPAAVELKVRDGPAAETQ